MPLDFEKQLEAVGILDKIFYAHKKSYDSEYAIRLRELIVECNLRPSSSNLRRHKKLPSSSSKIEACATGFGNMFFEQSDEQEASLQAGREIWLGRWAVQIHDKDAHEIGIRKRFDNEDDPECYILSFLPDGDPGWLLKVQEKMVSLPFLGDVVPYATERRHKWPTFVVHLPPLDIT